LNSGGERDHKCQDSDHDGDYGLRSGEIEPLPNDLHWSAVPVKSPIPIDTEPSGLGHSDLSHIGRPFAFVDCLKRNAL
jgi:hypothetical protein